MIIIHRVAAAIACGALRAAHDQCCTLALSREQAKQGSELTQREPDAAGPLVVQMIGCSDVPVPCVHRESTYRLPRALYFETRSV